MQQQQHESSYKLEFLRFDQSEPPGVCVLIEGKTEVLREHRGKCVKPLCERKFKFSYYTVSVSPSKLYTLCKQERIIYRQTDGCTIQTREAPR